MAVSMIDGVGEIQLRHTPSQCVFAGGYSAVTIEGTSNEAKAKRFTTGGESIISDSRITLTEYKLTLAQETQDMLSLGLSAGELPTVIATTDFFTLEDYVVPASIVSPATTLDVIVTGLVTANLSTCYVTMFENGAWNTVSGIIGQQRFTPILTGVPAVGEVLVAVGKLTFNIQHVNAPIVVSYAKTTTGKLSVGLASNAQTLKQFSFSCKLFSDAFPNGLIVAAPSCARTSPFSYKSDDVSVIENTFTMGVAAGKRTSFQLIQL